MLEVRVDGPQGSAGGQGTLGPKARLEVRAEGSLGPAGGQATLGPKARLEVRGPWAPGPGWRSGLGVYFPDLQT